MPMNAETMIEIDKPEADDPGMPAHERVYRALRARILSGGMAPGDSLTLRGVAEALGVSMTPAREAVRRLAAERALEMTSSGRILVPTPGPAQLDELFRARALLEPELAIRALPRVDSRVITALSHCDEALGRHVAVGDVAGYVRANNLFHTTLYARAGAPALMALVESVWLQTAPVMRRVYGRLGTAVLTDYHEAALTALSRQDPDGLAEAIRADVNQGAALVAQVSLDLVDL